MNVQELIDKLLKIEDKTKKIRHRVSEGLYGTELVWQIQEETVYTPITPYFESVVVIE